MIRERIVQRALAQCGKPYIEHGWGPKSFDCIGLVGYCGREEGVLPHKLEDEPEDDIRCYSSTPNPLLMRKGMEKYFTRIDWQDAMIADILWFRDPEAQHLGIVSKASLGTYWVVHANLPKGKVLQQRVRNNNYIVWAWRYPELVNG